MEREVKMAAKLYEMRDTAKRLLGEKYAGHMAMNGKILQDTATSDKPRNECKPTSPTA